MTTIAALPTPPLRSDPANFATRGDAFLGALPTFATQVNAVAAEVNGNAVSAASSATTATTKAADAQSAQSIALAIANYKGEWSSLSGALNIPASVSKDGLFYALVSNTANVAGVTPGVSAQWVVTGGTPLFRLPILQANVGYAASSVLETVGPTASFDTGLGNGPNFTAYNGTLYVAMAGGSNANCSSSTDGETWTLRAMPSTAVWSGVGWDGVGQFLALVSGGTAVGKSADGITWSAATALAAAVDGYVAPVKVGGLWFVPALGNTATYYTSSDGTAWTTRTFPVNLPSTANIRLLASGVLWVRSSGTTAYTTTDGINWTSRTPPVDFASTGVQPDGSLWGASGTTAYRTTDGVNWTTAGLPALISTGNTPAYMNGVYVSFVTPYIYTYDEGMWTPRGAGLMVSITTGYQSSIYSTRFGGHLGGRVLYLGASAGKVVVLKVNSALKGLYAKA